MKKSELKAPFWCFLLPRSSQLWLDWLCSPIYRRGTRNATAGRAHFSTPWVQSTLGRQTEQGRPQAVVDRDDDQVYYELTSPATLCANRRDVIPVAGHHLDTPIGDV